MCDMFMILVLLFTGYLDNKLTGASLYEAECGGKPADVAFVLDSSSSIRRPEFEKQKSFISDVVKKLDISQERTRVALFIFSDTVTPQFGLDTYSTREEILEGIDNVHQEGGGTSTDEALAYLREKVFSEQKERPGVPRIAIVLTDGMSQRPPITRQEAKLVHNELITVFVVGIGSGVDMDELASIASKPTSHYVYEVNDFDFLKTIEDDLTFKTCRAKEIQKIEEEKIVKACTGKTADVYFALDSSSSISREDFKKQRMFTEDVANLFDISEQSTRVGLIQFSDEVTPVFGINNFTNKESILGAISKIRQSGGGTLTDKALSYLREKGFANTQKDTPNVVIMLTDGMSQFPEQTKEQAKLLHASGVSVFVIGIGFAVDRDELKAIASDPDKHYVFEIDSFDFLQVIMPQLALKTCSVTAGPAIQDFQSKKACGGKPADVVFALDTSSSITSDDYQKQKQFAEDVVAIFDVGAELTRVGLLQFSYDVMPMFGLKRFDDRASIVAHIAQIRQFGGGTRTDMALQYIRKAAFAGARSNVPKIAIILTDGMSEFAEKTKKEANLAHEAGISVFVIGIGDAVDSDELSAIASNPDDRYMFNVIDFDFLETIRNDLALKTCNAVWPPMGEMQDSADEPAGCNAEGGVDLGFGVDAHWLGSERSTSVYRFISELTDGLDLGESGFRVSVTTQRCTRMPEFRLNRFRENYQLTRELTNVASIDILSLFGKLRGRLSPSQGARTSARKVAVLFATSDTEDRNNLEKEIKRVKFARLEVVIIAVGDVGKSNVGRLATKPFDDHFIHIASLAELESERHKLMKVICGV